MSTIDGGVCWCNFETYRREKQRFKVRERPADWVAPAAAVGV